VTARTRMRQLSGMGVSDGIAIGRAVVIAKRDVEVFRIPIPEDAVESELERFRSACGETKRGIQRTRRNVGRLFGQELAAIFDAHQLLLGDRSFVTEIERRIQRDRVNAEWAVHEASLEVAKRFAKIDDEYLRERGQDLEDVSRQLLRTLQGIAQHEISEVEGDVILVADDLVPSEAIRLGRANVVGFVVEAGGRTSHTSIIARSLGIPAVAGVDGITELVTNEDPMVVDGQGGVVVLHPTDELLERYTGARLEDRRAVSVVTESREEPARTADGVAIELMANIDLPEELDEFRRSGARGIGLYRSEFLYMETDPRLPTESDHLRIYRKLIQAAAPFPATIRTYDLGGRKLAREMMESAEENPVLGLRGIRLMLARPQIFHVQLRALLRSASRRELWIMAPMVSRVEEVRAFRSWLEKIAAELDSEGVPRARRYKVGIMIEVPAAAIMADVLAREVDFFALGTNDLIQYSLAVDRNNRQVADLYQPLHPAILRMLRFVLDAGRAAEIPVSLCGEMASDERCLPVLLGLGLRRFSVHPRSIGRLKRLAADLDVSQLEPVALRCCDLATAHEVETYLRSRAGEPDVEREKA
jgi:phosphoenolpyruvate-protein phosphotransferase (PTS system enzyme I)